MDLYEVTPSIPLHLAGEVRPVRFRDLTIPGGANQRERDLEDLLVHYPGLLNLGRFDLHKQGASHNDLLVIARQPQTSNRKRADLFALDRAGNLVVVEVKRDAEDANVRVEALEFQAIRYAAASLTMSAEHVIGLYASYLRSTTNEPDPGVLDARAVSHIAAHLADEDEELDRVAVLEALSPSQRGQKIYLVAADFDQEVLSACAWLREHHIDVTCFRLRPYRISSGYYLQRERLIPPPELGEFYTSMALPSTPKVGASSRVRQQSDKPARLIWKGLGADGGDEVIEVDSWRGALIEGVQRVLKLGLPSTQLPMSNAPSRDHDDVRDRAPEEVGPDVFIATKASAEIIRKWLAKSLVSLRTRHPVPVDFLQVETQGQKVHQLPGDESQSDLQTFPDDPDDS